VLEITLGSRPCCVLEITSENDLCPVLELMSESSPCCVFGRGAGCCLRCGCWCWLTKVERWECVGGLTAVRERQGSRGPEPGAEVRGALARCGADV